MAYISFQPSDYFNTKLYTGNNSSNAITGVGFQPDLVWTKNRGSSGSHMLFDAIRGVLYRLSADTNEANASYSNSLTSFDSDGFTLNDWGGVNSNSNTFVSWNWKANGAGSANTDGSINTTATSVNTTAGFSMCKYTGTGSGGATIGHGLGVVPKTIWVKNLDATNDWRVYHHSIGNTHRLVLNDSTGDNNDDSAWNDTSPTSSVFTVGSSTSTNASSQAHIAYCFAEKTGFSKFGTYNGNGSANGTFVYCGFKPSLIICKRSDSSGWWSMFDLKRDGYNPDNDALFPSTSDAENTSDFMDILSNGFKLRDSNTNLNNGGSKYLYWAWASEPLVASNGDVATAR
jgi:hypothetical protein